MDPLAWDELLKHTSLPAVGATSAHPELFPENLGIGRRTEPRNEYLGLVITRPEKFTVVLGLNYRDAVDDGDNEDMFELDTRTFDLETYMRGASSGSTPITPATTGRRNRTVGTHVQRARRDERTR